MNPRDDDARHEGGSIVDTPEANRAAAPKPRRPAGERRADQRPPSVEEEEHEEDRSQ